MREMGESAERRWWYAAYGNILTSVDALGNDEKRVLLRRRRKRGVRGVAINELREEPSNEELHLLLARIQQRRRRDALPELAYGDDYASCGA